VHVAVTFRSLTAQWDLRERKWFHAAWWTQTYAAQYASVQPAISIVGTLARSVLIPPDIPAVPGRRRKEKPAVEGKKQRQCKMCGQAGHYAKKCKNPDVIVMWKARSTHNYETRDLLNALQLAH
jgi:hypothetical protein